MAYFLDNYPVSEKSANLALTEEQEKYCRVVYKLDDEGGARFADLWDPDVTYSDEFVIVPLQSTDATTVSINKGTNIANVIGSNGDDYPEKYKDYTHPEKNNWLHLWIMLTKYKGFVSSCMTDGRFYTRGGIKLDKITLPVYNNTTKKWEYHDNIDAACSGSMVGGHIIANATEAATVGPGHEQPVYIIPICSKHNIAITERGNSFGTGFYMKLGNTVTALQLIGYLRKAAEYLEEFKDEVRHE